MTFCLAFKKNYKLRNEGRLSWKPSHLVNCNSKRGALSPAVVSTARVLAQMSQSSTKAGVTEGLYASKTALVKSKHGFELDLFLSDL